MDETLEAKLRMYNSILDSSESVLFSDMDGNLDVFHLAKKSAVEDSIDSDYLLYLVFNGHESYYDRLSAIDEKYSSFFSKVFTFNVDEEFDEKIRMINKSMNVVSDKINGMESFLTEDRKNNSRKLSKEEIVKYSLSVGMGLMLSQVDASIVPEYRIFGWDWFSSLFDVFPYYCMFSPILYGVQLSVKEFDRKLDNLKSSAKAFDKYVKSVRKSLF